MMREMASAHGVTLPNRVLAAVARPVLAGSLRTLPFIFGELLELMADRGYVVAGETDRDVLFRPR